MAPVMHQAPPDARDPPEASPDPLRTVEQAALTFEVLSSLRHDLRNKLAPMRNVVAYVRRQIRETDVFRNDPRLAKFLDLIEAEVAAANGLLENPPVVDRLFTREVVASRALACAALAVGTVRLPGGSRILTVAPGGDALLDVDPRELAMALRGLLENALEVDGGEVRMVVDVQVTRVGFEVHDARPGLTAEDFEAALDGRGAARPEHVGLSLKTAGRVARRYGGELTREPAERGTVLRLTVARGAA